MTEILQYIHTMLSQYSELKYVINYKTWQTDFLRFFHSQTNYNISKESIAIGVSIYKGKRNYSFNIDNPDAANIDVAVEKALDIIDSLPEDPDFVDIETDLTIAEYSSTVNNILAIPLEQKTKVLQHIADAVRGFNFEIYGTFICNFESTRILNSNGIDKVSTTSPIYLEVKAVHNESQVTVLETFGGEDFSRFDLADFTDRLTQKVRYGCGEIVDVEAGHYDVVLAPRCIAEFVQYLSGSMSAQSLDQKSSYFEDRIDEQVFPEYINITDDPTDPDVITSSYNGDGHIYRPLKLVENGVYRAFMCSNYYAHKTGLPKNGNTGNCLVLKEGDKTLEQMIGSIKYGIYVSSLHYMNFMNVKETSLTGLTRDGTFLIEDGKITKVINNLRFTERITRILKSITMLENRGFTIPFSGNYEFFGIETVKAPHVLVKDFNVTSSTNTI